MPKSKATKAMQSKNAKIFIFIIVTLLVFSVIGDGVIQRVMLIAPASEEAYFANDIFADNQHQGKTVQDMVKRCESAQMALKATAQPAPATPPVPNMEAGTCIGSIATFSKVKFPEKICLPSTGVTLNQMIGTFLTWAQKNPAKSGFNFTVGYLEAFSEAFPCSKK